MPIDTKRTPENDRSGLEMYQTKITADEVYKFLFELKEKHGPVGAQGLMITALSVLYATGVGIVDREEFKQTVREWGGELARFLEEKMVGEKLKRLPKVTEV